MVMLTYGFGVGLAGFAGVLGRAGEQISPLMGSNLIIVVFAVVVIGGMGSILGSVSPASAWHHRGHDQGILARGQRHGGVHDHGGGAHDPSGRPVREGKMSRRVTIAYLVGLGLLLLAPMPSSIRSW
jgi:hypothetical protein